jgi:hypothetical protein
LISSIVKQPFATFSKNNLKPTSSCHTTSSIKTTTQHIALSVSEEFINSANAILPQESAVLGVAGALSKIILYIIAGSGAKLSQLITKGVPPKYLS